MHGGGFRELHEHQIKQAEPEGHATANRIPRGLGHRRHGDAHHQWPQAGNNLFCRRPGEIEVWELKALARVNWKHDPHNHRDACIHQVLLLQLLLGGRRVRRRPRWSRGGQGADGRQALGGLAGLQIETALHAKDRPGLEGGLAFGTGCSASRIAAAHHLAERFPAVHAVVPTIIVSQKLAAGEVFLGVAYVYGPCRSPLRDICTLVSGIGSADLDSAGGESAGGGGGASCDKAGAKTSDKGFQPSAPGCHAWSVAFNLPSSRNCRATSSA